MSQNSWTRDEEIIVFNLYCKIPFKKSSKNHPEVIKIAKLIGRSPSAVNMKIGNFGSFDETLKSRGIVGLKNASKLDAQIWQEFNNRWDELSFESERLIAELQGETQMPARQKVNQDFFQKVVFNSYGNACCITGLSNSEFLTASHIKGGNETEKTNPANGLCLNALHSKAFVEGFITVAPDHKIHVSKNISDVCDGATVEKFFTSFDRQKISLPEKFAPLKDFLTYHNEVIFQNWK